MCGDGNDVSGWSNGLVDASRPSVKVKVVKKLVGVDIVGGAQQQWAGGMVGVDCMLKRSEHGCIVTI